MYIKIDKNLDYLTTDVYNIKHIYYQQLFFTNEYTLLFDIQSNLIGSKESRCA